MSSLFDSPSRFDSHSLKWGVSKRELPMWVADMDFQVAKEIRQALQEVVDHGILGYSLVPEALFESMIAWWQRRYAFSFQREWMVFSRGVLPSISCLIRCFSAPGDGVLVQSPVYHMFYQCINDTKREVVDSPLIWRDGGYEIDFDCLEKQLEKPSTKIFLLCNPHNPIGKIWDKDSLQKIGHLCQKHGVLVIADEIHCDITTPNLRYIPFASVDSICANNSITLLSPGKSFNVADLHIGMVVAPDASKRRAAMQALQAEQCQTANIFGIKGALAAYTHCDYWLDSLLEYIDESREVVRDFIDAHIPGLRLIPSKATYLLWMDYSKIPGVKVDNNDSFCDLLREKTGLYVSKGSGFGANGVGFLRMNIATSRDNLLDGLQRLKAGASF